MPGMKTIINDGFWHNNPALVQILGLCPLLAVTGTVVNGLALGLATTLVLLASNVSVSAIRGIVRTELRIPVFVLIIACFVTAVELLMKAWFYDLYLVLGIFIPLIVTNCAIIARAEAFASKNGVIRSAVDGLAMGLGFTVVLVLLGATREIVGRGSLMQGAHLLFGEQARELALVLVDDYRGFLLAILPPGAFIGLGLLIAIKNRIDSRRQHREQAIPITAPAEAK